MTEGILTAALSFVATNLDDIVVLMLLFSVVRNARNVMAGQFLGVGILTAASMLGAAGLGFLPSAYLHWLGLVPFLLGLHSWLSRNKAEAEENQVSAGKGSILSVALLTVANGGDNIGVWLPLFAGYSVSQRVAAVAVFAVMTGLWCILGRCLSTLPGVAGFLERYGSVLVPWVLMLLGLYILFL